MYKYSKLIYGEIFLCTYYISVSVIINIKQTTFLWFVAVSENELNTEILYKEQKKAAGQTVLLRCSFIAVRIQSLMKYTFLKLKTCLTYICL